MKQKYVPFPAGSLGLFVSDGWGLNDWSHELWQYIPNLHRRHDAVAVVGSGCLAAPTTMHGLMDVVGGFDVVCCEPRQKKGEMEGNAYHNVVTKSGHPDCPYRLYYGYMDGTLVGHHFTADMLNVYDGAKVVRAVNGVGGQQWAGNDPPH